MPPPPDSSTAADVDVRGSSDRTFGFVFAGFFSVVALAPLLLHGGALRPWALGIAALFAALAGWRPGWLAHPNRLWTRFGRLLHRVTSPVALAAVYLIGIVPTALVLRALGKDPLRRAWQPAADTYWIARPPAPGPAEADAALKHPF